MTPPADTERYKNHRFPGEIISHGVWLYYRFPLSYRDVQELLFERGCWSQDGAWHSQGQSLVALRQGKNRGLPGRHIQVQATGV